MLVPFDETGMRRMIAALRSGEPVILPPPSPITYGVAGTDPARVNIAKARPADQPTAIGLTELDQIATFLDADPGTFELIDWLVFHARLTVLVPTKGSIPDWLSPATVNGAVLMAGAWLPQTLPIIESVEHLYLSSGNRTSQSPSATAAAADRQFDGELLVLDGDALRTPNTPHGATTMVRVSPSGEGLSLARHGINDRDFDQDDTGPFLDWLRAAFTTRSAVH
jgi:L-threonylcarbamoyladenylate synthase